MGREREGMGRDGRGKEGRGRGKGEGLCSSKNSLKYTLEDDSSYTQYTSMMMMMIDY